MPQHLDEETLTLVALGVEEPDPVGRGHLDECPRCRSELEALRRVVVAGRSPDARLSLTAPPDRVWANVAAALQQEEEPRAPRPARRPPTWLAVAAGLVVGALGGGLTVAALTGEDGAPPETRVLARAQLAPLGATGTPGSAEVRQTDGARILRIRIDDRTAGGGFREVWLLNAETGRLVSLGVLNGTAASFELPEGLDLEDYPLVDVSREPFDGDPGHSSDSIARGELGA